MNRCRPGTAMLFALTIVEVLAGKEKRDEVAGPMIVAETL
jgi:protein DJ-1